ncbi:MULTISPECIES: DUF2314 domain-containing protein [Xanthomonas]|uniref:DUF2314 domain-containing protein n=1 Tax=Xanthomonas TaxID=338 RepID=UPI001F584C2D|nr:MULTISPECIES: DUF2314 domain-containing protein [Xanthomonas]MCI2245484.1 DUF2314 domain-containing protein [Xanthomonas indica]UYC11014.1 DUF2314 domain-containing protein [Xanthomonas sp. CFBP 8445]
MSEHSMYFTGDEDAAMQAAYIAARGTFKFFWRELSWEYRRIVPGLEMAAVKFAFATDAGDPEAPPFEHMWVGDVQFDGETVSGTLLNDPHDIASLQAGAEVTLPFAELEDWMYVIGGKVYGGYTIDAQRREMAADERAEHDAAWGLEFGPPGQVQLVPSPAQATDDSAAADAAAELSLREHPMSENIAPRIDENLRSHPEAVHARDGQGWTLLQRDALAGNYQPVALLLQHGADPSLRTPQGRTALELAQHMGWPRIVQLLQQAG